MAVKMVAERPNVISSEILKNIEGAFKQIGNIATCLSLDCINPLYGHYTYH